MYKFILLAIAMLVFQQWGEIARFVNPPPDYSLAHNGKVILYSTAWCGYCRKARRLLADYNIPYHEYDIEKSTEGREQHRRLGGGGVPLMLINGKLVRGYDPSEILRLVKES